MCAELDTTYSLCPRRVTLTAKFRSSGERRRKCPADEVTGAPLTEGGSMGQEWDRSPSGQQGLCAASSWPRLKLTLPERLLVLGCKQSLMQMRWLESSQKGCTEGQVITPGPCSLGGGGESRVSPEDGNLQKGPEKSRLSHPWMPASLLWSILQETAPGPLPSTEGFASSKLGCSPVARQMRRSGFKVSDLVALSSCVSSGLQKLINALCYLI